MKPLYLRGFGLFTPRYASPEAWCRGESDPEAMLAEAKMLEGPLKRRASELTRISVEVFDQATRRAGIDPSAIPTIWATAHGEHGTAIKLLKMMIRGDGKVSPTHFHNSVHNTASAYASISGGNASASTTLTGGPELVASALLEAFCHVDAGTRELAVVLADEPLHDPFDRSDMQASLGIAFSFSAQAPGALAKLSNLRREAAPAVKPHSSLGGLYVSAALGLLEQAVAKTPGTVALEISAHRRDAREQVETVWCVDFEPIEPG